jgi:phosphonatase-like hydrolase
MRSVKLIVLDVGGTIIQDGGEVQESFVAALQHHDVPVTLAEVLEWKGAAKAEVIRHFVQKRTKLDRAAQERLIDQTYVEFRERLEARYRSSTKPIDGAEKAFRQMGEQGYTLVTTSGFYKGLTETILKSLGWQTYFAACVSSDDVPHGRPSPFMIFRAMEAALVDDVQLVVNVGDTPLDLQAGNNSGVRGVIGVLTGVNNAERLGRERHTHLLPSVATLPELLRAEF